MAHARGARYHRRMKALSLFSLCLLALLSLGHPSMAAESLCEPGFVHRRQLTPPILPVAARLAETPTRSVTIQWIGHSSFLITTPGGTTVLTDPHVWHTVPTAPDIVTVSNERPTHNQVHAVPGQAQILRGRASTAELTTLSLVVGDLLIRGLPNSGGPSTEAPAPNTIFVFRVDGLCIVHLGNLRQPLTDEQRQRLGRPDVLMVPIDGQWTLSYEQVALTVAQLRPAIILPMHYDAPEHAHLFMQFIKDTVAIRTLDDRRLQVARGMLPSSSELVVLGYRGDRH